MVRVWQGRWLRKRQAALAVTWRRPLEWETSVCFGCSCFRFLCGLEWQQVPLALWLMRHARTAELASICSQRKKSAQNEVAAAAWKVLQPQARQEAASKQANASHATRSYLAAFRHLFASTRSHRLGQLVYLALLFNSTRILCHSADIVKPIL